MTKYNKIVDFYLEIIIDRLQFKKKILKLRSKKILNSKRMKFLKYMNIIINRLAPIWSSYLKSIRNYFRFRILLITKILHKVRQKKKRLKIIIIFLFS